VLKGNVWAGYGCQRMMLNSPEQLHSTVRLKPDRDKLRNAVRIDTKKNTISPSISTTAAVRPPGVANQHIILAQIISDKAQTAAPRWPRQRHEQRRA